MHTTRPTPPDDTSSPFTTTLSDWFTTRDAGVWLVRVGLLLLAGAGGWFIRYAVVEGWVGPVTRLVLASTTAVLLVVAGDRMRERRRYLATALTTTGVALAYFVTVAASQDLGAPRFSTLTAALILAATTVLLAIRLESSLVAATGLFAASIAPALVTVTETYVVAPYSVAVLAAVAYLSLTRGWSAPVVVVSATLSLLGIGSMFPTPDRASLASIALVMTATWLTAVGTTTWRAVGTVRSGHPLVATLIAPMVAIPTVVGAVWAAAEWWDAGSSDVSGFALASGLAGLVHLALAVALSRVEGRHATVLVPTALVPTALVPTVLIHGVTAALLAAATTTDVWSWRTLPSTLAVAVFWLVAWAKGRRLHDVVVASAISLIPVGALWAWSLDSAPSDVDVEMGLAGILPLMLTGLAVLLTSDDVPKTQPLGVASGWAAAITATGWTLEVSQRLDDWAGVLVTLLWMLAGTIVAAAARRRTTSFAGVGLVGVALVKLVFDDTAHLDPLSRVTIYAALGVALTVGGWWALRRSAQGVEPDPEDPSPESSASPEPEARV